MSQVVKKLFVLALASVLAACTVAPPAASHDDDDDKTSSRRERGDDDDDDSEEQGSAVDEREEEGEESSSTKPIAEEPDPVVDTSELDPFFKEQMQTANIPGIGIAVVRAGHLKWTKGYGLANIAAKKPVGRDTLFMLASVSKTVTTACLMQLIEDPKNGISLDDDVSTKVGFSVRNPSFTSTKITYRMLLTHTSSFIDGTKYNVTYSNGDFPTALEPSVKSWLADPDAWQSNRPGQKWEYSNSGIALAGLLVEKISGQNLQAYAKSHLFDPLGMKETSYFLKGLDQSHIAQPYGGTNLEPQGFYGYPDYPAGQIRTSAPQLAKFLMMLSNGGEVGGVRLLKSATVQQMITPQVPSIEAKQGLTLFSETKGGKKAFGHDGSDKGVLTQMFFDPKTKAGYVLLMNARDQLDDIQVADDAIAAMADKLMELALTLP